MKGCQLANISRMEGDGISSIEFEAPRIHFFKSDVFEAVSVVVLEKRVIAMVLALMNRIVLFFLDLL